MSKVTVALPATRLKLRLRLHKGQSWSVVEHCLLDMLARRSLQLSELVTGFSIHRALVEEGLMRLMRVGWVEPALTDTGIALFRATRMGRAALMHEELPSAMRSVERERWHLFERVTGHVFAVSDLNHIRRSELRDQPDAQHIQVMEPRLDQGYYRPEELTDIALEDDELLVGVEPAGEFVIDRLALVDIVDGEITGLPPEREVADLRRVILDAARAAQPARSSLRGGSVSGQTPRRHAIHFQKDDLVVGGRAHRDTLQQVLRSARTKVIIHSTFLSERRFMEWWDPMVEAMERGVQIDILWGQDSKEDAEGEQAPSRAEIAAQSLLERPEVIARQDKLRIHPTSTRSHAKVIVADRTHVGWWEAIIGSCNWLDTPFKKVEASVWLRDAAIVQEILRGLMTLAHGGGPWSELVTELYQMAKGVRSSTAASAPNGFASVVSDSEHNTQLLRARDKVRERLLLVSHRLGAYYDCGALLPLAAACRSQRVDVRMLYSRNDRGRAASQLEREARAEGMALGLVSEPQLHAKLLAWDEDSIVVTSQNWMSRDPGFSNLMRELGIAIEAPGAARHLMGLMDRELSRRCA